MIRGLDSHITGNYGEDFFLNESHEMPTCKAIDESDNGKTVTHCTGDAAEDGLCRFHRDDVERWTCPGCGEMPPVDLNGCPGCGTPKPGYECCYYCEKYYPIATFNRDGDRDPICGNCLKWQRCEHRKSYTGLIVVIALLIIGVIIMGILTDWGL